MKRLSVLLLTLIGLAVLFGGCAGKEDDDVVATSPTPATPTEETPSVSPTIGASPSPRAATPESEADRALAAAEVVLGGVAGPDCTPTAKSPVCILPAPSLASPKHGIAAFDVSIYPGGGAIEFLGKMLEGEWQFWFGTQDTTYQLTVLPGDMRVCAGGAGLNLRVSPSVDSEALALLADDEVVTVDRFVLTEPGSRSPAGAEAGYGWYRLAAPEERWAYSKYLSDASLGDCSLHDALVLSVTPASTQAPETPTGGTDPQDFAEFAIDIARAVEEQDTTFFASRVKGRTYTCTESDFVMEGLGPAVESGLCQEVGQQVEVVLHSYWHSEGLSVRPERTVTAIEDYFSNALSGEEDDYGTGAVRLYAIGTTPSSDPTRTYEAAILTAITPRGEGPAREPVRTVRGIHFEYVEGRWVIRWMRFADVLAEELLSPDTAPYDQWERH
jgi:hypothetical protein